MIYLISLQVILSIKFTFSSVNPLAHAPTPTVGLCQKRRGISAALTLSSRTRLVEMRCSKHTILSQCHCHHTCGDVSAIMISAMTPKMEWSHYHHHQHQHYHYHHHQHYHHHYHHHTITITNTITNTSTNTNTNTNTITITLSPSHHQHLRLSRARLFLTTTTITAAQSSIPS